ncbi:MAG: ester cyclase [Hyphomonadaceae bacterium]|nr:ester cyclase [Hyphomonadaceae bacterium]
MGILLYAASALVMAGGYYYWRRMNAPVVQATLAFIAAIALGALVCAAILTSLYMTNATALSPQQRGLYALFGAAIGFAFGTAAGALIGGPIWMAGVLAIRKGQAPRPYGDIIVGLAAAFATLAILWRPLGLSLLSRGHPPWHWLAAAVAGALAGFVYWLLAGRPASDAPNTEEINKAAVRAYVDAFNAGDFDRLRAVHTPDAIVRGVLGWGGIDEVMPIWKDLVNCLGMQLEIEEIIAQRDFVSVRFKETGTAKAEFRGNPATGKSYEIVAMEFYELKEGKIHRRWGARDSASIGRQLGWSS